MTTVADITYYIEVKQEHIDKGEPKNPQSCPIALAFREQDVEAGIFAGGVLIESRDPTGQTEHIMEWDAPEEVEAFVKSFDEGGTVDPFVFQTHYYVADNAENADYWAALRKERAAREARGEGI